MSDADRYYWHGKLEPMAADVWFDRPRGLRTWGRALGTAVLCAGLVVAVVLAGLAAGL